MGKNNTGSWLVAKEVFPTRDQLETAWVDGEVCNCSQINIEKHPQRKHLPWWESPFSLLYGFMSFKRKWSKWLDVWRKLLNRILKTGFDLKDESVLRFERLMSLCYMAVLGCTIQLVPRQRGLHSLSCFEERDYFLCIQLLVSPSVSLPLSPFHKNILHIASSFYPFGPFNPLWDNLSSLQTCLRIAVGFPEDADAFSKGLPVSIALRERFCFTYNEDTSQFLQGSLNLHWSPCCHY